MIRAQEQSAPATRHLNNDVLNVGILRDVARYIVRVSEKRLRRRNDASVQDQVLVRAPVKVIGDVGVVRHLVSACIVACVEVVHDYHVVIGPVVVGFGAEIPGGHGHTRHGADRISNLQTIAVKRRVAATSANEVKGDGGLRTQPVRLSAKDKGK